MLTAGKYYKKRNQEQYTSIALPWRKFFSELDKGISKTININTLDCPSLMHWMSRLFICCVSEVNVKMDHIIIHKHNAVSIDLYFKDLVFSTSLYKVKLF